MGEVESLEDLTPGIELFHTLIGLERYEDAFVVFQDHLSARHALPPERESTAGGVA